MNTLSDTKPEWYAELPAEQQGVWSAGDRGLLFTDAVSWNNRVRVVLKDGTIFDGTMGDERNRWDSRHAIAIRIPKRKSQKWISSNDIAVVWGDKGRPFTELLEEFLTKNH